MPPAMCVMLQCMCAHAAGHLCAMLLGMRLTGTCCCLVADACSTRRLWLEGQEPLVTNALHESEDDVIVDSYEASGILLVYYIIFKDDVIVDSYEASGNF